MPDFPFFDDFLLNFDFHTLQQIFLSNESIYLGYDDLTNAEVLMGNNVFKKAKQRLTEISDDPKARELARLREDAEVNYKIAISYTEAKGKAEIARKLLAEPATASLSDEQIANLTGLPVDEIRAMRQQGSK